MQADIEQNRGNYRLGRELYAHALAAYRSSGGELVQAVVLINSAELEYADGHPDTALRSVNDALEILLRGKNATVITTALANRATYRVAMGDFDGARESARESLRFACHEQGEGHIAASVESIALVAVTGNDPQRAARLRGYVDAQFARTGQQRTIAATRTYERLLAALHETLSEDEIVNLTVEGAAWSEDRAVEEALKV